MKLWMRIALLMVFLPVMASAQYRDLDTAMSNLEQGFGNGQVQAIIAGIAEGEKVNLQFPGLVDKNGFFGRDQAAYLLDELFNNAKPGAFQQKSARKVSAEKQYHIRADWTVQVGGRSETRELYITLQEKNDRYSVASIRSTGR